MNKISKLLAFVLALAGFASCEKPIDTPISSTIDERTIIYTIGEQEELRTVNSENEWDALLDRFCDYAMSGEQVAFYSIGSHSTTASKVAPSISTTDRNELKRWMKAMEREGKTVSVSYDENTGTWRGVAYLTVPIVHGDNVCYTGVLTCVEMPIGDYGMATTAMVQALQIDDDTVLLLEKYGYLMLCGSNYESGDTMTLCGTVETRQSYNSTDYLVLNLTSVSESAIAGVWELTNMESNCITTQNIGEVYDFDVDGMVTRTIGNSTESGTWTIDTDGSLCCTLLPRGGCWSINWVSTQTMIISRIENGNYTFIEFERQNK